MAAFLFELQDNHYSKLQDVVIMQKCNKKSKVHVSPVKTRRLISEISQLQPHSALMRVTLASLLLFSSEENLPLTNALSNKSKLFLAF